jgi:predicted dehydrogenase
MGEPARTGPVGIGMIGAGTISAEYLENFARFPDVRVVALGDLRPGAAEARGAEFGIPIAGAPDVVLDHPDVEIVVNLTVPMAHAEVALRAIDAGKHVWN